MPEGAATTYPARFVPAGARALVVEDDRWVRSAVEVALRHAGIQVVAVASFEAAEAAITASSFDVIVLDVMLPAIDGIQGCRSLRAKGVRTPILVLTALGELGDRLVAFDAGADDHVRKPFTIDELLARVGALLRRADFDPAQRLIAGDLFVDLASRTCVRGPEPVALTRREFDFVVALVRGGGSVVGRDRLREQVWPDDMAADSRAIDMCASSVRRKLGDPPVVETVRGEGYRMRRARR